VNESGGAGMDDERGADIGAGADVLEARYRLILMLLPTAYRQHRGEEMISTLLDGAPEGRRWPSIGEVASLAALATRLRVGAQGGTRRAVAVGEVLRRTALTGLLAMGVWHAVAGVANAVALFFQDGYYARYAIRTSWTWPFTLHFVQLVVYLGAFTALVLGHRRLGRVLGVAQAAITLAEVLQESYVVSSDRASLLAVAAVIALAAGLGFHRGAAPLPTPGRWLLVGAGITGFLLIVSATLTAVEYYTASVPSALSTIAGLVAGPLLPALAAVFGVLRARRSPIWPAALLLLGLPGLILVPRAVMIYVERRYVNVFVGDLFASAPWLAMASYMAITDTILAAALAWALYRRRNRSTAVAT
jgi:hypothetical protein